MAEHVLDSLRDALEYKVLEDTGYPWLIVKSNGPILTWELRYTTDTSTGPLIVFGGQSDTSDLTRIYAVSIISGVSETLAKVFGTSCQPTCTQTLIEKITEFENE